MNSCVLIAKVIRNPELRYTQDNQTEVAQMLVEFEGQKPEDQPSTLKVVGWGNLATQIKETCTEGDRLIIEGRLSMNVFERPEGFKEKRAELTASRIYPLGNSPTSYVPAYGEDEDNVVSMQNFKSTQTTEDRDEADYGTVTTEPETSDRNLDEIPF